MFKRENFVSLSVDNDGYFRTALLISLVAILTLVLFHAAGKVLPHFCA